MNCVEHFCYYSDFPKFPVHFHTSCEVGYLYNGDITIVCSGKEYRVTSNTVYLLPSCMQHEFIINDREHYDRLLMFINPWTKARMLYSETIQNMLMGFTFKEPIVLKDTFGCDEILKRIERELERGDALSDEVTAGMVTEFLAALIRKSGHLDTTVKPEGSLIIQIKEYIQEHISEKIVISELADRFFISKFHLSHLFKEQLGMSPKQFLTFARLSKAHALLCRDNMSISEISDACGFSNPSEMTRQFKEQHGISPTQFRKSLMTRQ